MQNRSPIAVFLLTLITFGIYGIYWMVKTKGEMNERGAVIPTAWLIIIPFVNLWWMWKYSEGVELVTANKISGVLSFILLWLLGSIGMAIIQDSFNKVGGATVTASPVPAAPFGGTVPEPSTPTTVTPEVASADQTPPAPTVSG